MSNHEIITKLIGPINAVGESHVDEQRLANLNETIKLVDRLISDIYSAASTKDRVEHSMKTIGQKAHSFLVDLKECLEEDLP